MKISSIRNDRLAEYQRDLKEYNRVEKLRQPALALLLARVDPRIRNELYEFQDPSEAWKHLEQRYKSNTPAAHALQIAYRRMEAIYLPKCTGVVDYINRHKSALRDIKELGGTYDDKQLEAKTLRKLGPKFQPFMLYYNFSRISPDKDLSLKDLYTQLILFEQNILENATNDQ